MQKKKQCVCIYNSVRKPSELISPTEVRQLPKESHVKTYVVTNWRGNSVPEFFCEEGFNFLAGTDRLNSQLIPFSRVSFEVRLGKRRPRHVRRTHVDDSRRRALVHRQQRHGGDLMLERVEAGRFDIDHY